VNEEKFIEVLGTQLKYRTSACNPKWEARPTFKVTVQVTDVCPAKCAFCCNPGKGLTLDPKKFIDDFQEITSKVAVDEVYFTGGEPMLHWDLIKQCLPVIKCPALINTMGLNLHKIDELVSISLSRHHWDHDINNQILGVKHTPEYVRRFAGPKHGSNVTTNIIKGYVDTADKMRKMMDWAMDNGFPLSGFVGLMDATQYATDYKMPIPKLEGDDIHGYRKFKWKSGMCSCSNSLYIRNGELQRFYIKENLDPTENKGGRIFYRNGIVGKFIQTEYQQKLVSGVKA
jgi:pyruvate-formate lyase-activating enzyme